MDEALSDRQVTELELAITCPVDTRQVDDNVRASNRLLQRLAREVLVVDRDDLEPAEGAQPNTCVPAEEPIGARDDDFHRNFIPKTSPISGMVSNNFLVSSRPRRSVFSDV